MKLASSAITILLVIWTHGVESKSYDLSRLTYHPLSGKVALKGERTIVISNFVYDGEGPDAFFIVGVNGDTPTLEEAIPVPYPAPKTNHVMKIDNKSIPILKEFKGQDIILTLPDELTNRDIKWLSLFCRDYNIDFGNVVFNKGNEVLRS